MSNIAKQPAARRGMMGALMAMGASSLAQAAQALSPVAALAGAGTDKPKLTLEQQTRLRLREQRTPNVRLLGPGRPRKCASTTTWPRAAACW